LHFFLNFKSKSVRNGTAGTSDFFSPPSLLSPQVDEIMLTLKQAFSVAALQQSVRTQSQQCDSCPMQQLHRLCERIEGEAPSLFIDGGWLYVHREPGSLGSDSWDDLFSDDRVEC